MQAGRRAGRFDDELVDAAAELLRHWAEASGARWITAVPSDRSGPLVPDFARAARARGGAAVRGGGGAGGERPPQREMANSQQQVANVRGAFRVNGPLPEGPCLLVDDLRFSGWTLAMLAGQLRRNGVPAVYPLALATAF